MSTLSIDGITEGRQKQSFDIKNVSVAKKYNPYSLDSFYR